MSYYNDQADRPLANGPPSQSSESGERPAVTSNYLPRTHSYTSHKSVVNKTGEYYPTNKQRHLKSSGANSLGRQISQALALGTKGNHLFACLLLFNLSMSILNTILLSFVVKSGQSNEPNLFAGTGGGGGGGFKTISWNEHLEGVELNLPAHMAGRLGQHSATISLQTIESFENEPLLISPISSDGHSSRRLTISATRPDAANDEQKQEEGALRQSNRIIIDPSPLADQPVEIITNNLVWDELTTANQLQVEQPFGSQSNKLLVLARKLGGGGGGQVEPPTSAASRLLPSRRLFELDGGRQLIVLPTINQINLHPAQTSWLAVRDELRAQAGGLVGMLDRDFDIQTRQANLTCLSSESLRLISRSSRLSLASRRALIVEAPHLRLAGKRLHLAEGIEYLERRNGSGAAGSGTDHSQGRADGLLAYDLVLVDGHKLMACAGHQEVRA